MRTTLATLVALPMLLVAALPTLVGSVRLQFPFQQGDSPSDVADTQVVKFPFQQGDGRTDPIAAKDFWQIASHAGLYVNKFAHPEFAHTVLVTPSNSAYSQILQNWRCKADKLGLDYIVVAFDPALEWKVGPKRAILSHSANYAGEQRFRSGHFNEMSCMKLEMVKEIARAGFDVVFSDPDNVFVRDPFARGASLGDKIRSGHFDYVYQPNLACMPRERAVGKEVEEANTGFYYVRGRAKRKGVQALFSAALAECKAQKDIDDQTNFWNALRKIREGHGRERYGGNNFECANLCQKGRTCEAKEQDVLSYCEMDPFQHPTGWSPGCSPNRTAANWAVTYHANLVLGAAGKIDKLDRQGLWDHTCAGPPPEPA